MSLASQVQPVPSHRTSPAVTSWQGWTLHEYEVASSTNFAAATLPVWHAVRANKQTAGRGRFQRKWVSDEGGLWLSAVVPFHSGPGWRALPLAIGLAVCDTVRNLGVHPLRMRWPNDVLVQDRKLAGLLIDQVSAGTAVAGVGVNVRNCPEAWEPELKNHTTRLADLVPNPPTPTDLAELILSQIRGVIEIMSENGFAALILRINQLWDESRLVELDLDGQLRRGQFLGVDEEGRLLLAGYDGSLSAFEPHEVRHLTEIDFKT